MSSSDKTPVSAKEFPWATIAGIYLTVAIALAAVAGGMGHNVLALGLIFVGVFFVTVTVLIAKESTAKQIISALQGPSYRPLYDRLLDWALPKLRSWFAIKAPAENPRLASLLKQTFTYRLLDRAMLLAVIYPLLLLISYWGLSGNAGKLGEATIIPALPEGEGWKGLVTLCGIAFVMCVGFYDTHWAAASPKRFVRRVSGWLTIAAIVGFGAVLNLIDVTGVAFAGAFAGAIAGAIAGAVAVAGAFAVAVAVGGVLAFAFANAVAGAFAVAVGGVLAFAFAVEYAEKRNKPLAAALIAVLWPIVFLSLMLFLLPWSAIEADRLPIATSVFLFLGVAPLINALFDTISYGATLALTQRGRAGTPWVWALCDAVLALGLFLALGAAFVAVIVAMQAAAGVPFADLGSLLTHPIDFGTYWWLYAMLFSTALPTLLHLMIVGLSWQSFLPLPVRQRLVSRIELAQKGEPLDGFFAVGFLSFFWLVSLCLPLLLLFVLGWVFWSSLIGPLLYLYQDLLVSLFTWLAR